MPVTYFIINYTFFKFRNTIPDVVSTLFIKNPNWPRHVRKELWFAGLDDQHIEVVLPVFSDQMIHTDIPAQVIAE